MRFFKYPEKISLRNAFYSSKYASGSHRANNIDKLIAKRVAVKKTAFNTGTRFA